MELMADFPDGHFDLAIVDPPYGIGADSQKMSNSPRKGMGMRARKEWNGNWDTTPPPEYFEELRRVSKHQIVWGGNYFPLPPSRCWLMWDKLQEFTGSDFELAWTSMSSPAKAFRLTRVEAYNQGGRGEEKIHPTQKPVKLYDWLLANYAEKGQRVLDTHMGSGSIAIAAHYAGIHLTACEIDPDYYHAALARIERETRQLDFFSSTNA
jgi:site-specific DNA-methyltransferase (adenine-specific)